MNALRQFFGRNADLALVIGVASILLILFAPVPAVLLDLLIIINFAFALTILLLTFYVTRPVEFSTFPSLLLVATLFRLSLNVAATRLILANGDAGQVIGAIGSFSVQGNFIIGLVVFFILVVVQYVVVTNGAQRVSEVAARFVLDAMPGQQMSIDADLNMGLIDQDEAKRRRKDLEKEAAFYGAMDGASKFVKGDAIAGIIILLIDIIGGWLVGIAQMGMPWGQALQTFTLLTIGDGIVTQVPALIVSVATGIIVTRSGADKELSVTAIRQLVLFPKIQLVVIIALLALLALPGMPKWPIVVLLLPLTGAWFIARRMRGVIAAEEVQTKGATGAFNAAADAGAIEIGFGKELAAHWLPMEAMLAERVSALRTQYLADTGFTLPPVRFHAAPRVAASEYEIQLLGARHAHAMLLPNKTLAIRAGETKATVEGVSTRDPAFGLPAVWIEKAHEDRARILGYTLVDPLTVLVTHLTEVVKAQAWSLLTRNDVAKLLEGVRSRQPGLIEELVPSVLALSDIQRVLQNLLAEGVPIRNVDLIAETLVDVGRHQKDPATLTEVVRQKLGHLICQSLRGGHDQLAVLTMDPSVELAIATAVRANDAPSALPLIEPRLAEHFIGRLVALADSMMRQNLSPVLLCAPEIRRHLKTLSRRAIPRLAVISVNEIPYSIDLKSFGVVSAPKSFDASLAA